MAEVDKQCLGQDFGVAVYVTREIVQQAAGPALIPGWYLELTMRNPLLGQPPLVHTAALGLVEPDDAKISAGVADGIMQLRQLSTSKVNGMKSGT